MVILLGAAGALVTGGVAVVRRHDRSWIVTIATGVGALVTVATLMQIAEGLGWISSYAPLSDRAGRINRRARRCCPRRRRSAG